MSAWTWRQAIWESNLTATTKIVLQALASHLNDFGDPMFPSQERLSRLCSLSERAIITHLQIAEEQGWIRPRKRELRGSKWAANEYVACWPDGVNKVHPWGEGRSPGGVKEVHPNSPSEQSNRNNPPAPKGEPDAFDEIWAARWSRGEAPNPRKTACEAYHRAIKKGHSHADILAGVKARIGVDVSQVSTSKVPQMVTWLNQERWKDGGGAVTTSPDELKMREQEYERRASEGRSFLNDLARKRSDELLAMGRKKEEEPPLLAG